MNRTEFINEVFKFCGKDDDKLMQTYDLALSTDKNIDWDKLYKIVITEAKNRYLPAPSFFIDLFKRCIIADKINGKYDGIRLKIYVKHKKLKDGYPYEFETYDNSATVYELKQKARNKFGDKFMAMEVYDEDTLKWNKI